MELYENIRDFYTYADENGIVGCCALHIDMVDLAEVRSLVVRPDMRGQGIGQRLLEACLDEARALDIARVYALTRNPVFFRKNGFSEVQKHDMPHKVWNDCVRCPSFPDCDEIAMVRVLTPAHEAVDKDAVPETIDGTLGFLGFGNMGGAILKGLLKAGTLLPENAVIYDIDADKAAAAAELGVKWATSPEELAAASDIVMLAVKPQTMADALGQIKPALNPRTLVISIAAGISIGFLQGRLGNEFRVVRVMPNTPALVSAGAAGIALSENCTPTDAAVTRAIFNAVGIAERVPESMIDAVTALSGSGPAYFFYMIECLVNAAVAEGLEPAQAARLAAQTMYGAAKLLIETQEPAAVLRERVTSKGGTTFAALEAFRAGNFEQLIAAGVRAAVARAKELGK
jgi:pyrroline-5-carboxylate reductase